MNQWIKLNKRKTYKRNQMHAYAPKVDGSRHADVDSCIFYVLLTEYNSKCVSLCERGN